MQNGKTIKTWKNVEFNVDIFNYKKNSKNLLTNPGGGGILSELRLRDLTEITKLSKRNEKSSWQQPVGCDKISKLLQEKNKNNFKKVKKSSWQAGNDMI